MTSSKHVRAPKAVVGLATLGLALITAWLALGIRKLARLTATEVDATWRPILLPVTEKQPLAPLPVEMRPAVQPEKASVPRGGDPRASMNGALL